MKAPRIIAAFMMLIATAIAMADITLYTSRKMPLIEPILTQYTAETGVKFNYVAGEEAALIARMEQDKKDTVKADIFWTQDSASLNVADERGLLAPVKNAELSSNIGKDWRSANNTWFAMSLRTRPIFYNSELVKPSELSTYEQLADPKWNGKLCLRTSRKVYTISLVASLYRANGEEATRRIVSGWVNNLATAPFNDDQVMLTAVDKGQCAITVANAHYFFQWLAKNPDGKVRIFYPNQKQRGAHVNISGMGVVAGSANAKQAQDFIVWLSRQKNQEAYSAATQEFPINVKANAVPMMQQYGSFKRDALLLKGSDEQQEAAVRILKESGYQ